MDDDETSSRRNNLSFFLRRNMNRAACSADDFDSVCCHLESMDHPGEEKDQSEKMNESESHSMHEQQQDQHPEEQQL